MSRKRKFRPRQQAGKSGRLQCEGSEKLAKTHKNSYSNAQNKKDQFRAVIRKRIKEVNELAIIAAIKDKVDKRVLSRYSELTQALLNTVLQVNELCRLNNDVFTLQQLIKFSELSYNRSFINLNNLRKRGFVTEVKKREFALTVKSRIVVMYYNRVIGKYLDSGEVAYL